MNDKKYLLAKIIMLIMILAVGITQLYYATDAHFSEAISFNEGFEKSRTVKIKRRNYYNFDINYKFDEKNLNSEQKNQLRLKLEKDNGKKDLSEKLYVKSPVQLSVYNMDQNKMIYQSAEEPVLTSYGFSFYTKRIASGHLGPGTYKITVKSPKVSGLEIFQTEFIMDNPQ